MLMLFPGAVLHALRGEAFYVNPDGKAGVTMLAARAIGVMAAAPKAGLYQFPVSLRIDQMLRGNDLGTSQFIGQVAA